MLKTIRLLFVLMILLGSAAPGPRSAQAASGNTLTIQVNQVVASIHPLMRGSNAPSWLADRYSNATFRSRTKYSGLKYLRLPGGSWSNMYGWLGCEMRVHQVGTSQPCGGEGENWSSWITRPTDYINFLRATNMQAIYIVNVNASAQESAALVAFFNGDPSDTRLIGVDRYGQDWQTVGHWAQLRVDHGNPQPFKIRYWEVGNEVYGATQAAGGSSCMSWGWENAWTCDGAKYINGDATHDGYLSIRAAMRAVDPTIRVGAVGLEDMKSYNNWGRKVLQNAGSVMDYYVIHPYPYGTPPANTAAGWVKILAKPRQHWPALKSSLQTAFNNYAGGRNIPIAASEFNLVYSHDLDTQKMMKRAGNMLFMAESIGQAIANQYFMFDQWSLSNGCSYVTASCYDLLLADDNFSRQPQYFAFPLWARFGNKMLGLHSNVAVSQLSAYAGRKDAQTFTVLVINKTGTTIGAKVKFSDGRPAVNGNANVIRATSLNATSVIYNNSSNIPNNLSAIAPLPLPVHNGIVSYNFPPYSITLLQITAP
ncbi:MAG: alpha-L-arabinofuranosidase [Anaerolineaceae bacterium]|nr:MAG: alpha-L-arabinofuranosidase [Anaerolineaceae bacterium]